MTKHCHILDLPMLPDQYAEIALAKADEYCALDPAGRAERRINFHHNPLRKTLNIIRSGQEIKSGRTAPRIHFEGVMDDWVNENISEEWNAIDVAFNLTPLDGNPSDEVVAHTDIIRSYTMIYLLDISNHDQDTVFYQEKNKPLHRKRNTKIEHYDDLVELERLRFPLHKWVILDSTVLHAVENVKEYRTAIHIGFDIDPTGFFYKY